MEKYICDFDDIINLNKKPATKEQIKNWYKKGLKYCKLFTFKKEEKC